MEESYFLIGQNNNLSIFSRAATKARSGEGSIISVAGEPGYGKTNLLRAFEDLSKPETSGMAAVYTECQEPVGKFNVAGVQPLKPFENALKALMNKKEVSPEKKFAMNVGMSVLSAVPFVGDFVFAVKELGRDWRQFQRDKSSHNTRKVSGAAADFYDAYRAQAENAPLVILMDDMHWADSQSVELLNLFMENIQDIPIIFVVAYKQSIIDAKSPPFSIFLQESVSAKGNIEHINLKPFTQKNIGELCSQMLNNYRENDEFEKWLYERTLGAPGTVVEYVKYFQKFPPFDDKGELSEGFRRKEHLPTSIQANFGEELEKLSEEEKNLLAICSAEGRQFSVNIVSKLLNTDILTTIRKLRNIRNKTGLIKSLGAKQRYGQKATVYSFTQSVYFRFFEKQLEFEEYTALHGQIADLLKKLYEESETEELKEALAPYIAAHSAEAGDDETAKSMLVEAAKTAEKYGSADVVKAAYDTFRSLGKTEEDNEESETPTVGTDAITFNKLIQNASAFTSESDIETEDSDSISKNGSENGEKDDENGETKASVLDDIDLTDFKTVRKALVKEFLNGNFTKTSDFADEYIESQADELTASQNAQIMSIAAKAKIETGALDEAEEQCERALELVGGGVDEYAECLALNVRAVIDSKRGLDEKANKHLRKVVEKSISLPDELKLLTLTNLAVILREKAPEKSREYVDIAKKICLKVDFQHFAKDARLV